MVRGVVYASDGSIDDWQNGESRRGWGGVRYYSSELVARIQFIKRAQNLGFTLKEVSGLLDLSVEDRAECGDVLVKTEEKIGEIDQKIKDLKRMRASLQELADCCVDRSTPLHDCPILDCFVEKKRKHK